MTFLEQLVKEDDDEAENGNDGLAQGDDRHYRRCRSLKRSMLLDTEIGHNEICTSMELHNHSRSDCGCNTKLHESYRFRTVDLGAPRRLRVTAVHNTFWLNHLQWNEKD